MKGLRLLFAVLLVLTGFSGARATDADDTARAATRRGATNTVSGTTRQKSNISSPTPSSGTSRQITGTERATTQRTVGTRTNTTKTTSRSPQTDTRNTSARTATNVLPRAVSTTPSVEERTPITVRSATRTPTSTRTSRSAVRLPARSSISRSATSAPDTTNTARANVMSANYTKCRDIFYSCMDEFCANKDSQLKRCACSSRVNEFDGVQEQLNTAEEKMLDFSQRLLTVNMDREDAAALFTATEGELAFNKPDTSASQRTLDKITKNLSQSFDSSVFEQNLSPISLSLNEDLAFDTIDSLQGASTTLKTGPGLYSAALPVCREMTLEQCTQDELDLAESGYLMAIEKDCNTVYKTYVTQTDQAREKIREGSALLDMARLDIHQKRNSDDILTCKSKMLDMLSNESVCGTNLGKCLDTTGRYIDPSTGEVFLTPNLAQLTTLITRPTGDTTWTSANPNFVEYLNSKKKFLDPATEKCQDISDYVWDAFIEDALAQIKLAQDAKLEEVRQSCTTLTAQCLNKSAESLADFDARALSTFGVIADLTVNAMCETVRSSCTALLDYTGETTNDWEQGITDITTDKTYDTIMKTCREIGRACIIEKCKSISGNFGLCENIDTSINRKSIINRSACWNEVEQCVRSANRDALLHSFELLAQRGTIYNSTSTSTNTNFPTNSFYTHVYGNYYKNGQETKTLYSPEENCTIPGNEGKCINDICSADCGEDAETYDCKACRIAEQIWGNCEAPPETQLADTSSNSESKHHNQILTPTNTSTDTTTLLYWFAVNTGTANSIDSCRDTSCGPGATMRENVDGSFTCIPKTDQTDDGEYCPNTPTGGIQYKTYGNTRNCCTKGTFDSYGNCCANGTVTISNTKFCAPANTTSIDVLEVTNISDNNHYLDGTNYLVCLGTLEHGGASDATDTYPSGRTITCTGRFVVAHPTTGIYYAPNYDINDSPQTYPTLSFKYDNGNNTCTLTHNGTTWAPGTGCPDDINLADTNWLVTY